MSAKVDGSQANQLTEFQKNILSTISDKIGIQATDIDKVKLSKINVDNYYGVIYNFMGTGIHIPENEVDELEYIKEGIGIWKTCSYVW